MNIWKFLVLILIAAVSSVYAMFWPELANPDPCERSADLEFKRCMQKLDQERFCANMKYRRYRTCQENIDFEFRLPAKFDLEIREAFET